MAKKETFSRFDAAEYLKTEEDMALYLDAMIEESNGDPRMIAVALGDIAKARGMRQSPRTPALPGKTCTRRCLLMGTRSFPR